MIVDVNFDVVLKGNIENGKIVGIPNPGIESILKTLKEKGYEVNVFSYFLAEHENYKKMVAWCAKNKIAQNISSFSIRAGSSEDSLLIDNRSINWEGIPDLYNKVNKLEAIRDEHRSY